MSREGSPSEWVHPLADVANDPRCGGKARGLAKLIAAGLPVPPGIVIDSRAFAAFAGAVPRVAPIGNPEHELREAGPSDEHEFSHRLAALDEAEMPAALLAEVQLRIVAPLLAVRSSATIEDAAAGAGAGLFSSKGRVEPEGIAAAIKMVWMSAMSAAVAAYARRRDASVEIAVIVQAFVEGEQFTVYTRPPGAPTKDEVIVQRGAVLTRFPRSSTDELVQLALRAEAAIGATQGADVEIIRGASLASVAVVQARPIIHPKAHARLPLPAPLLAGLVADGRKWTWDVTHNPDPLSTAQTELVERVNRAGVAPYALRTVSGFLYAAPLDSSSMIAVTEPELTSAPVLLARVAEIERRLAATLRPDAGVRAARELSDAVERYVAFYKIWSSELSPLISAARRLSASDAAIARPSSVEATLIAGARGELSAADVLRRLGMLSPAWDVATPVYAEKPRVLIQALVRARDMLVPGAWMTETRDAYERRIGSSAESSPFDGEPANENEPPPHVETGASLATIAADLAERDDLWFAQAQWLMRRALIARGRELGLDDGDVFWLPFDELAAGIDAETARRKAAGARAAMTRAAQWDPPLVVHGEMPTHPLANDDAGHVRELRGIASGTGGGKASGRVVKYASLASAVMAKPGDVIVARAITPALAVMVIGCAAIVSETGGLLDHGAAMARELGIPCVVGCRDAWRVLENAALVEVDGDAGIVRVR